MTATVPDSLTDLADAVDEAMTLPCEMGQFHQFVGGDSPAIFLMATTCPSCHDRDADRLICLPCWEYAAPPRTMRDKQCGAGGFLRDECWTILRVIGGA